MRRSFVVFIALAFAGCGKMPAAHQQGSSALAEPGDAFPQKGNYHLVHDGVSGSREESDMRMLDVSDRKKFEDYFVSESPGCGDRDVQIGHGSFDIRTTCSQDDLRNLPVESHGSYTRDSIDMTTETTLGGRVLTDVYSYKLTSS